MSETEAVALDVLGLFKPAAKHQLKARIAIDGPTGAGKTFTALQWARILAGPDGLIGYIDTEEESALFYSPTPGETIQRVDFWDPPYEFAHMPWRPPFDPRKLAQVLKAAAPHFTVIVVDSGTHFWTGEGGTLDIVDSAFTGWKEGSPAQRYLLDTFLRLPCHFIMCMRSKMEYVVEQKDVKGKDGKMYSKMVPRKVGLAPEQRAGIEYEFTVVADMDLEHRLTVSKTRCSVVADAVALKGRSAEVAQRFAAWLDSGVQMPTGADVEAFGKLCDEIPDASVRKEIKVAIFNEFGHPERMTVESMTAAQARVAELLAPPPPEGPGDTPVSGASEGPGAAQGPDEAPSPVSGVAAQEGPPDDTSAKNAKLAGIEEAAAAAGAEAIKKQNARAKAAG